MRKIKSLSPPLSKGEGDVVDESLVISDGNFFYYED
jgi:hypothetical protein